MRKSKIKGRRIYLIQDLWDKRKFKTTDTFSYLRKLKYLFKSMQMFGYAILFLGINVWKSFYHLLIVCYKFLSHVRNTTFQYMLDHLLIMNDKSQLVQTIARMYKSNIFYIFGSFYFRYIENLDDNIHLNVTNTILFFS